MNHYFSKYHFFAIVGLYLLTLAYDLIVKLFMFATAADKPNAPSKFKVKRVWKDYYRIWDKPALRYSWTTVTFVYGCAAVALGVVVGATIYLIAYLGEIALYPTIAIITIIVFSSGLRWLFSSIYDHSDKLDDHEDRLSELEKKDIE